MPEDTAADMTCVMGGRGGRPWPTEAVEGQHPEGTGETRP